MLGLRSNRKSPDRPSGRGGIFNAVSIPVEWFEGHLPISEPHGSQRAYTYAMFVSILRGGGNPRKLTERGEALGERQSLIGALKVHRQQFII